MVLLPVRTPAIEVWEVALLPVRTPAMEAWGWLQWAGPMEIPTMIVENLHNDQEKMLGYERIKMVVFGDRYWIYFVLDHYGITRDSSRIPVQ